MKIEDLDVLGRDFQKWKSEFLASGQKRFTIPGEFRSRMQAMREFFTLEEISTRVGVSTSVLMRPKSRDVPRARKGLPEKIGFLEVKPSQPSPAVSTSVKLPRDVTSSKTNPIEVSVIVLSGACVSPLFIRSLIFGRGV